MIRKRGTKLLILTEAFKLFVAKPYEKVTFQDVENNTGLSRGAILYHVDNKESMFRAVIKHFILKDKTLITDDSITLKKYIRILLQDRQTESKKFAMMKIKNYDSATVRISEALKFYWPEGMGDYLKQKEIESQNFKFVIDNAVKREEIISETDSEVLTSIFDGLSYCSLFYSKKN